MANLFRAEWLRMRKRQSVLVICIAIPVIASFFFVTGFGGVYEPPPFDEAQVRQQAIDDGYLIGVPPELSEQLLQEYVAAVREGDEQQRAAAAFERTRFAFPASLVTILGNGTFVLLALILLAATSIGDEFSWATIRTSLIASSHRWRQLSARLIALFVIAVGMFAALLALGSILPLVLGVAGTRLVPQPPFDVLALLVLVGGYLLASVAAIAFAAMATLLVRSGSLTLVAVLIYATAEIGILVAMSRFPEFQADGDLGWVPTLLPVRGLTEITNVAGRAATGLPEYPGEAVARVLDPTLLPILSLAVVGAVFAALAYRRFARMDIVE